MNARDVTERVRLEEELTHQAYHDGLTGVANRALFRDRLDQAIAHSTRTRAAFSVLIVDLDGFKGVNDSLGHDAGDELLHRRRAPVRGGRSARATRSRASAATSSASCSTARTRSRRSAVGRRLLEHISRPLEVAGHQLALGGSIGVAVYPRDGDRAEDLVRRADVAMYAAKEAGRGRVEAFRHEFARELGESLGLEHELRLGIQRGEFHVHYQPEIDLTSGAIVGVEALLRWTSPSRGVVPPLALHPDRRGHRPHPAPRGVRAAGVVPSDGRLAPAGPAPAQVRDVGQRVGPTACRQRVCRARPRGARVVGPGARPSRPRGDRDGDRRQGSRQRARTSGAPATARLGRPARRGRLRDRVLIARPAAPLPGRRHQGRPDIRPGGRAPTPRTPRSRPTSSALPTRSACSQSPRASSPTSSCCRCGSSDATSHRATPSPTRRRLPRSKASWPAASR